jgi:hypothetical protein
MLQSKSSNTANSARPDPEPRTTAAKCFRCLPLLHVCCPSLQSVLTISRLTSSTMVYSLSPSPLRSMELSPLYSSQHISFGDASSVASPFYWTRSTYPTTPTTPDAPGLYATAGFGHGGEDGYFEDEIEWRTTTDGGFKEPLHLTDARGDGGTRTPNGNGFLEHCRSEHCFFGCGGSCVPLTGYAEEYNIHTSPREYDFDSPRSSYFDTRNVGSVEKSYRLERGNSTFRCARYPSTFFPF